MNAWILNHEIHHLMDILGVKYIEQENEKYLKANIKKL